MWSVLGAMTDLIHALAMGVWVLGLPLLFVRRWPRLRLGYAAYAVVFVIATNASMLTLDECFLTTISRYFWEKAAVSHAGHASAEWFTVRLAYWVFGMAPSHHAISVLSEVLVLVTAAGVIYSIVRHRQRADWPRARTAE